MEEKSRNGLVFSRRTVSRLWEEEVEIRNINMREGQRKSNVNVLIYDDYDEEPVQYLGISIIPRTELDTPKPLLQIAKCYTLFSVNLGVVVGESLAMFLFISSPVVTARPMPESPTSIRYNSVMKISIAGLREIKF